MSLLITDVRRVLSKQGAAKLHRQDASLVSIHYDPQWQGLLARAIFLMHNSGGKDLWQKIKAYVEVLRLLSLRAKAGCLEGMHCYSRYSVQLLYDIAWQAAGALEANIGLAMPSVLHR